MISGNIINWLILQDLHDLHVWQDETESHLLDHQKLKANQYETVQEHSIDNKSIYISGSICDCPHLDLTEKSWFVSRYFKSINIGMSKERM